MPDVASTSAQEFQREIKEAVMEYELQLKKLKLRKEEIVKQFATKVEALEVERMKKRVQKRLIV